MFMVKAFMSLKFHDGEEDKQKVNDITVALENAGIINYVMVRDCENYGKSPIPEGLNLMPDFAFPKMAESDMLIVEFTEKGVGLGMGAGFASALDKPIYVIAKTGSDISSTMKSVAREIIFYDKPEDLTPRFKEIAKNFHIPPIILASQSEYRKKMLKETLGAIPFSVIASHSEEISFDSDEFDAQLKGIALQKALTVLNLTRHRGKRIIIGCDQNIVFNNTLIGKPKNMTEAYELLCSMQGSNQIYSHVANVIIIADKDNIVKQTAKYDIARMSMDKISEDELISFLEKGTTLKCCGGFNISDAPFVHLKEGSMSTAMGMTTEFVKDFISKI